MPGFMLISGYFSAKKIDNFSDVKKRILLSAQHYVLPFLTWFILINIILLGEYNHSLVRGVKELFNHIDVGLWFLWVIFILSLIATICNWIESVKGNYFNVLVFYIIFVIILVGIAALLGMNFCGIKLILYYSIFYGIGWLGRKTENYWKKYWTKYRDRSVFIALIIFCGIVYNYDLYHCSDGITGITIRFIAGIVGNMILLYLSEEYQDLFEKFKLDWIGMYTLEIYTTHMYVNGLMKAGNTSGFFSPAGFTNFTISLFLTISFTGIIIMVFKGIPATNFLFYGKTKLYKIKR